MTFLQIHEPGQTPLPHEKDKKLAIGIDLGTTYSVVGMSHDNQPEILRSSVGHALVPSVIAITEQGNILVGDEAVTYGQDHPQCIISSIKRLMGKTQEDFKNDPWALTLPWAQQQQSGLATLQLGKKDYNPIVLSSYILDHLKKMAEQHLGHDITEAVITVPAYFDDAARTATRQAAQLAGLNILRLVNEPTAAALAYGLDKNVEGVYAVYDLGGGTFDFSLLRLQKGVFQVLGTGGHTTLGGDDADFAIVQDLIPDYQKLSPSVLKQWCRHARTMREHLSTIKEGDWNFTVDNQKRSLHLTQQKLDTILAQLVNKTLDVCRDVLADVDLDATDIHGIVLVGGMTRTPFIQKKVTNFFGQDPLVDINPDEVVAMGASLQAEALTTGSDTLLLDVVPLSLGLEMMGGLVEKIIDRNSPIPIAKTQEFTTYQDHQTGMIVHVVQGERELVDQCRSLAKFELHDIPAMVAGAARIRVTFKVDADGLLTVEAEETSTEHKQIVEVKPSYGLQNEDIQRMIYDSLAHAQEDVEQRLLIEARVEAEQFLHATNQALDEDRQLLSFKKLASIQKAIDHLKKVLGEDDRDTISHAVQKLEKVTHDFAEKRLHKAFQERIEGRTIEEVEKWTKGAEKKDV